jgi:hypothetical protein
MSLTGSSTRSEIAALAAGDVVFQRRRARIDEVRHVGRIVDATVAGQRLRTILDHAESRPAVLAQLLVFP